MSGWRTPLRALRPRDNNVFLAFGATDYARRLTVGVHAMLLPNRV